MQLQTKIMTLAILIIMLIGCNKKEEQAEETTVDNSRIEELLNNFILVEGGTFIMGSPETEEGRDEEEVQHEVTIASFYIQESEVTQELYLAVMGSNPSELQTWLDLPVTNVRWYDAIEFCNRLNELLGLEAVYSGSGENIVCNWNADGYRLPTEAEWEYAAKAGTTTDFYSGNLTNQGCSPLDNNLNDIAWYCGNSGNKTHNVGGKEPNDNGLYDMSSNVWEWCWDWYDGDYYDGGATTDPKGPSTIRTYRVLRGGSGGSLAKYCRSSFRIFIYPDEDSDRVGFRIVRTN